MIKNILKRETGFSWLFRRRLWFSLDVGQHRLLGYRASCTPSAAGVGDTGGKTGGRRPSEGQRSVRGGPAVTPPRAAVVSIDLRSAGIYASPTEKHQFTVA